MTHSEAVPYRRQLSLPGLLFGGGVLAALVGFLLWAPQSGTAVLRTLAPWSEARFTGLVVEPAGGEFPVGQKLTLTHRLSGRIPRSVEYQWRSEADAGWQRLSVPVLSNAVALQVLTVTTSVTFRVRAGDTVSPAYSLVAYVPPEVARLSLRLIPPAYSGLPELRQSSPPITALRRLAAISAAFLFVSRVSSCSASSIGRSLSTTQGLPTRQKRCAKQGGQ